MSVVLLAAISLYAVWNNKYTIYDYFALRGYNAPEAIAKLATEATMTDKARNIFYVNKPQISDRKDFRQQCFSNSKPEQTIVLGCYNGVNIYIFQVDDPQLNGVEQVTAAHEMLHAAYDRLKPSEKNRINKMVMNQYKKLNDPRINDLASSYEKQEPGSVPNELHSILGTEVKDVGPELNSYYQKYFTNRERVVDYALGYQQKFENIKTQVASIDADLALRKAEIDRLEAQLQIEIKELEAQKTQMDKLLTNGQTKSYNAMVNSYNQRVNDYNSSIAEVKILIDQYNKIVEQRNRLAVQQQSLAQNLDSRLSTIPGQ